jgi:hypothetical protein
VQEMKREHTSYTELSTFSQCRKKWHWKYDVGIERDSKPFAIMRGIVGHAILEHCTDRGFDALTHIEDIMGDSPGTDFGDDFAMEMVRQLTRYVDYWNYVASDQRELELHAVIDGKDIICFIDEIGDYNGLTVIFDRKFRNSSSFTPIESMELSGQVAIYQEACRQNKIHVDGFVVDQICLPPKSPKKNQNGSMSRVAVGDWRSYKRALLEAGLNPLDYVDMQEKLPDTSEFRRDLIYRPAVEMDNYLIDLSARNADLQDPNKRIYMCDDRMRCGFCEFRELCIEQLKGGDVTGLISTLFRDRTHR